MMEVKKMTVNMFSPFFPLPQASNTAVPDDKRMRMMTQPTTVKPMAGIAWLLLFSGSGPTYCGQRERVSYSTDVKVGSISSKRAQASPRQVGEDAVETKTKLKYGGGYHAPVSERIRPRITSVSRRNKDKSPCRA